MNSKTPDVAYHDMVSDILINGTDYPNRTAVGSTARIGHAYRVAMDGDYPVLSQSKKVYTQTALKELEWFISGKTDLGPLIANNVQIWNQWVKPDTAEYDTKGNLVDGELGPIYQHQWRHWTRGYLVRSVSQAKRLMETPHPNRKVTPLLTPNQEHVYYVEEQYDQLQMAVERLRTSPDCRRVIVSAWNPGELMDMALPPCHVFFQFCSRVVVPTDDEAQHLTQWTQQAHQEGILHQDYIFERSKEPRKLDLVLYMRSNDVGVGHAFNAFQYSMILSLMARSVGMIPGDFIFMGANVHLYDDQHEAYQEQLANMRTERMGELQAGERPRVGYLTPKVANALLDFHHTDIEIMHNDSVGVVRYPVAAK